MRINNLLSLLTLCVMFLVSSCQKSGLETDIWQETELEENLVEVIFGMPITRADEESALTRAPLPVSTPVTIYVFQRTDASTAQFTTLYKTAKGTSTSTVVEGERSVIAINTVNGTAMNKLKVARGKTYDFVAVINEGSATLSGSTLSGITNGQDIMIGRTADAGIEVNTLSTVKKIDVIFTAGGADSKGNLPHLTSKAIVVVTATTDFISSFTDDVTIAVKSLTIKNINNSATANISASPIDLASSVSGNYTHIAKTNSFIINSSNTKIEYEGDIFVLPQTAASLVCDLIIYIKGVEVTISKTIDKTFKAGEISYLNLELDKLTPILVLEKVGGTWSDLMAPSDVTSQKYKVIATNGITYTTTGTDANFAIDKTTVVNGDTLIASWKTANTTDVVRTKTVTFSPSPSGRPIGATFSQSVNNIFVRPTAVGYGPDALTSKLAFYVKVATGLKWRISNFKINSYYPNENTNKSLTLNYNGNIWNATTANNQITIDGSGGDQIVTASATKQENGHYTNYSLNVDVLDATNKVICIIPVAIIHGRNPYNTPKESSQWVEVEAFYTSSSVKTKLKWAVGNLVADRSDAIGAIRGCKIGSPTDGGLYFQSGSLVGYKGGSVAKGGTGEETSPYADSGTMWWGGASSYSWDNDAMVWPTSMTVPSSSSTPSDKQWPENNSTNINTLNYRYFDYSLSTSVWGQNWSSEKNTYNNNANIRDFNVNSVSPPLTPIPSTGNLGTDAYAHLGVGDPCHYYLGDGWRLPTRREIWALFGNRKDEETNPSHLGWTKKPVSNWNINNQGSISMVFEGKKLIFTASGIRLNNGAFSSIGTRCRFYSSSIANIIYVYCLEIDESKTLTQSAINRICGFPVRCVKE